MQNPPTVSIVIGSYNRLPFLKGTIETLRADVADIAHEIIVVDGSSTDGTIDWLTQQKDIISIIQHNRGEWQGKPIERRSWGYFMNLGFKTAQGKFICMLSDDCLVIPGAFKNGIQFFEDQLKAKQKVGAVAFYWRNWPEQDKYWVGHTFGDKLFVNHGLYLREVMEAVGFVDEDNIFFYHADGDLCMRMDKAGYKTLAAPNSFVEHYSDANAAVRATNNSKQPQDWATYEGRWGKLGQPTSDWQEKAFTDRHHTADQYFKKQLPSSLTKIKQRLIK